MDSRPVRMDQKIERSTIDAGIQNENFETDMEYAIQLNRWLLKPLGIWPLDSSSKKFDRRISAISPPVCYFILFFVMIPSFIKMFVTEKYLKQRLEIFGPMSFVVMVTLKHFAFMTRGEKLKQCIDTVVNDWRNVHAKGQREIMIKYARTARLVTIICVSFMYCGGTVYTIILPLVTARTLSKEYNLTIRILPYPCNFIYFDASVRPLFDVVYIMHFICSLVMWSITTGVCSLAAKFVMHACGQCEIVMSLLENLIDNDKYYCDIEEKKLAVIVLQHLHVIRFVTRVEDLLNEVCLVEFLGCTMNMCLLGYYVITGWETADTARFVTFALLFVSFTFNIFLFCYIGQTLTNHCHQIGEASYMIDWYRIPGTQARFLVLLIGIANRPITLTAGKMVQLSFACFGNVLKASIAYLNILRRVTS